MRQMLISCSASLLALALSLSACQTAPLPAPLPASALEIHIAHINDHHSHLEATPDFEISIKGVPTRVEAGGFPRLTTLFKASQGLPNLLKLHAGDAMTGTLYHTLYQGEADAALMNSVCFDAFELGNHEFDEAEKRFRAHVTEAKFRIVSTNVTDAAGAPFPGVATSAIVPVTVGGRTVRIGLVSATIDSTEKNWVRYRDGIVAAKAEVEKLRGKVDAIVALTHLSLEQDAEFADAVPGVDLVLGGHEHENWLLYRGARFVPIVKADANVRSLAIVTLAFGAPGTRPAVATRLEVIDDRIPADPAVDALAKSWVERGYEGFRREGFKPEAVVATLAEPLDGRESTVRNRPGRLTDLITASMAREAAPVDVALFNGGSVRIDDVIPPGPITEYDVIRILPFGGKVVRVSMDGALLVRVLETGVNNQGTGGYLQVRGASFEQGRWQVRGAPIDPARRYAVALNDFLLSGGEVNLGFLTRSNPQVHDIVEGRDVRLALIDELKR